MKPRITVITLGVDNLENSLRFYRDGLVLPTQGIVGTEFEHGVVAFFDLQTGLKLAKVTFNLATHFRKTLIHLPIQKPIQLKKLTRKSRQLILQNSNVLLNPLSINDIPLWCITNI